MENLLVLVLLSFLFIAAIESILAQSSAFDKMTHVRLSKSLATSAQRAHFLQEWQR